MSMMPILKLHSGSHAPQMVEPRWGPRSIRLQNLSARAHLTLDTCCVGSPSACLVRVVCGVQGSRFESDSLQWRLHRRQRDEIQPLLDSLGRKFRKMLREMQEGVS